MEKKYIKMPVQLKEVNKERYELRAVFSTEDEDRHRDVVRQNFDLRKFKKNPVLLNSHNYGDATEVIGKLSGLSTKTGQLEGKVKFAVEENPKAKVIFDLYAGGFLNAFSIGFIPLKMGDDGSIEKSELLEVSAVSVPANAMALAKQKGIDVDELDNDDIEEEKKAMSDEEIDEVYDKYYGTVNMNASELEAWSNTECSKLASKSRKPIERNLNILRTKKADWTEATAKSANRTISFVSRMRGAEQGEPASDNCPSKRDISLKNWAFDPNKKQETKKEKQLRALRHMKEAKERRKRAILKETLAVIQQLQTRKVDAEERRRMVNRVMRQMLKIKE